MKILGLDYGTKRIGVALSDENQKLAFPHSVIENKPNFIDIIKKLREENSFEEIVVGEPEEGGLRNEILNFVENLKKEGFRVSLQKEFMTSLHTDMFTKTKPIARKTTKKREVKKDESAAALILQRYLDKNSK